MSESDDLAAEIATAHCNVKRFSLGILCVSVLSSAATSAASLQTILDAVPVSASQLFTQQTPIGNKDGRVYIAQVEPGPNGDQNAIGLHTVVRHGSYKASEHGSAWQWNAHVIEDRTIFNTWHMPPSIALDRNGFIHVAYNMHNFPWQYKVSRYPHNIDEFDFLGQYISLQEMERHKYENKTSFPTAGEAAIPGNQVTYPAFFHDQDGDLFVTYRFAARPARPFKQRTMSAGIAHYDVDARYWTSIGSTIPLQSNDTHSSDSEPVRPAEPFAAEMYWTAYHPRLSFGPDNKININWFWRDEGAGAELVKPCFLQSRDGHTFTTTDGMPATIPAVSSDCGNIGTPPDQTYYSIGNSTANSTGDPYILLSPVDSAREIRYWLDGQWHQIASPGNATEIFFDAEDRLWAIAAGLNIFRRSHDGTWESVIASDSKEHCYPRASLNEDRSIAYVYTRSCHGNTASVHSLALR